MVHRRKGDHYKVNYAFLVSPDRTCFVTVSVGAIANIRVRGTLIHTRDSKNRVYCTADNTGAVEIDVSRRWCSQLVKSKSFQVMLKKHGDMILAHSVAPMPYTTGREVNDFRAICQAHCQNLAQQGFIKFGGNPATHWYYTNSGALKFAVYNHFIGLARAVTFGRFPRYA